MFDIHLKNRIKHMHMSNVHRAMHRMNIMIHDERFWAIVALIALLAAVITLAFLIKPSRLWEQSRPVGYPYFP